MSTAVAERPPMTAAEKKNQEMAKNAWDLLNGMKKSIAAVLPKHLTPDRMAMIAFTAMRRTPKLLECSRESIIGSILTASMLGLEPSGPLGHGALIPYKGECQFQPMYQGLLELARRSGFIRDIQLRAVYKGDHYMYRFGLDPTIEHVPMEGDGADNPDRECTHVYCVVRFTNGGVQWDQMSYAQAMAHGKRFSRTWNTREYPNKFQPGTPWADHPVAMCLKTILKQTLKLCPKSPELAAAVQLDDMTEIGKTATMSKMDGDVFDIDIAQPDLQQIESSAGTSAIDKIVEAAGKKSPAAAASEEHPKTEGPAQGSLTEQEPDPTPCTVDDFTVIERAAADCKVSMKVVKDHVTKTMGFDSYGDLTKGRMTEVLKWVEAKKK